MDKRQKTERARADGSGSFSPRSIATPRRSLSQNAKAHRLCTFAILASTLPLAALAGESGSTTTVVLDVAKNGALGAFLAAAVVWLNGQYRQRSEAKQQQPERNPPLGEEAAKTYVTKGELERCQGVCRKDIIDLRAKIDANDEHAEKRSISTHRRIDELLICQQKTNKGLGMLIGIMVGKGIAPSSMASATINEEA